MKIYTRTGDDGTTGLFAGSRVAKCDARIEAFGSVDELNAVLGMARAQSPGETLDAMLASVQNQLFALGAELATPDPVAKGTATLAEKHVSVVEQWIDQLDGALPELGAFILPGGSAAAAALHWARCVCRRAEREVVALAQQTPIREILLQYLNRVSDLLFVMARTANTRAGIADIPWNQQD